MAQILKKYNFPLKTKSNSKGEYTIVKNKNTSNPIKKNYGDEYYDWDNIKTTYDATDNRTTLQQNEVSRLMFHCGVALRSNYEPGGTGANSENWLIGVLKENFGFKKAKMIKPDNYILNDGTFSNDVSQWSSSNIELMKNELDQDRPIFFCGFYSGGTEWFFKRYNGGGHAFILDGYDNNGLFHINWGWDGGSQNQNWAINNLNPGTGQAGAGKGNYNLHQFAFIGLEPDYLNSECEYYYQRNKASVSSVVWYAPYAEFATSRGLIKSINENFDYNKNITIGDAARTIVLSANFLGLDGYKDLSQINCNNKESNTPFVDFLVQKGIISQAIANFQTSNIQFGYLCYLVNEILLGPNYPKAYRTGNYTKAIVSDNALFRTSVLAIINTKGLIINSDYRKKVEYISAGFKDAKITGAEIVTNALLSKIISNAVSFKGGHLPPVTNSTSSQLSETVGSLNPDDYVVVGDKYEFNNPPFGTEIPQSFEPSITMKSGESKTFSFPDATIGGLPVHLYWTVDGGTLTPNTGTFQSVTFKAPVVTKTKVFQLYYYAATSGGYAMESYREITVTPNNSQAVIVSNNGNLDYGNVTYQSNTSKSTVLSLTSGSSFSGNARIVGTNASNFILNTLNVTLNGTSTQTLNISFSASSPGAKTATLEIYNTNGVVLTVPITGNVQANDACLSASVSSVDIQTGNTNVPAEYFFTITNQSTFNSITVTNVQFTGADAQYFSYDAQLFKVPQAINRSITTGFTVRMLNTQTQSRTYNATLQLTTNNPLCPTLTIPVRSQYLQSNLSFVAPADGFVYIMNPTSDALELRWQGQIPGSDPFNISVDIEYAVNGGAWILIPSTISCQVAHNNNNPFNIKTISYQDLSVLNLIGKEVQFRIRPCNLSNPWQYSGYVKFVAPNSNPIEITSPNGNEVFTAGEIKKIMWNDYVGFNNVDLFYSTNYGSSFIPIASGVSAKNGFYDWAVPNGINSDNCIVKVVAQNIFDTSDYKFFIQTPPVPITITNTTIYAEGCNTNPAGSISVNFTGGTPPFTSYYYTGTTSANAISGATTNTNFSFANLQSNNYNVILEDALGKRHLITNLFVPKKDAYGYLLNTEPDICGGGKGKLDINLSGSIPFPYSVTLKKNGTQIYQGGQTSFNNLGVGTYIVEVIPSDGCLYSEEFTMATTPGTYFPITPTVTNTSCSGSTGAISLNVGTAQTPTYLWSNGATAQNLTALAAGQYSVNVSDATGCVQTQKYDIVEEGGFSESLITSNQVNNDLSLSDGFLYFQTPVNSVDKIRVLNVIDNSYTDFTIPSYYNSSVTKKVENLVVKNNFLFGVVKETNNNITQIHFIKVDLNTKNIVNRVIHNQNKSFAKILFENNKLYALNGTTLEICNFNSGTVKSVNIPLNNTAYNFVFDFSRMKIYIVGWETQISEFDINTETIVRNATTNVRASQINLKSNELYIVGNTPSLNNTVVQKFDLSTFTSGPVTTLRNIMVNNYGQNFIKDNRYLYIPYLSPAQIDIFDIQTSQFTNIPITRYCQNIVYSSQNDKIYIGSLGQGLTQLINNKFDFTHTKTDVTCGLSNGSITLTIPNDGKTYTYLWSNGATSKDVSGLSAGDYTVTVTQTGGCSVRKIITIIQTSAAFTASVSPNNGNICPNTTLVLASSTGQSYVWYKDNVVISGATSQTYNVSAAGNYKVVVTNNNNCTASSNTVPVTIIPNPVSNFSSTVSGNTATFTNTSTNGNQYLWNFGDATTDTQFSPIKTYSSGGTFTVTLSVTNSCGISNQVSKTVVIGTCPNQPDLVITAVNITKYAPNRVNYAVTVKNQGSVNASLGSVSLGVFGSSDALRNVNDVFKSALFAGGGTLAPNQTYTINDFASFNFADANYYLAFSIDYHALLAECNENNNDFVKLVNQCSGSGDNIVLGSLPNPFYAYNGTVIVPNIPQSSEPKLIVARAFTVNPNVSLFNVSLVVGNCLTVPTVASVAVDEITAVAPPSLGSVQVQKGQLLVENLAKEVSDVSIWEADSGVLLQSKAFSPNTHSFVKGKKYIVRLESVQGLEGFVVEW